ncbi:MAG: potassium channel protein [Acidobacteria bacterium]|nr:potassium channel protein [Acidobacteriota bacterium]MCI0624030.1 potassium channel protein [Acidobacteriota bacterium]
MFIQRKLLAILAILAGLIVGGTLGYHYLEGWSLLDSFYMTMVILSTVGLGADRTLDDAGKLFTVGLIACGAVIAGFGFNAIGHRILENQLGDYLGRRKMEKETKKLQGHYIVCGAGRVGRRVVKEFQLNGVPYVVIEKDPALAEKLSSEGSLTIVGDAADEDVLLKAGIDKARGLITAISTDADNVYVTLTAKGLRPDLAIVTRAQEQSAQKKLLKAGATKVVMPYESAGQILAHSILKPNVADFIESVTTGDMAKLNLQLEEVAISPHSRIAGMTLQQSEIRKKLGIIIVAMKKKDGVMGFDPAAESKIEAGDCLIALGTAESLRRLEEMAG